MKALFVGLGSIGQRHLRNLKKLKPEIDIMAVRSTRSAPVLCDANEVVLNASIKEHYEIEEFDSLEDALAHKPDMVFVTNPTSFHLSVAIKSLLNGAFVFIEKPLSHEWKGIEDLIKAERDCGKKRIAIGYQFRFHPALKLLKKILKNESIGNITSAQLTNGEYMPGWHPYEDYRLSYAVRKDLGGGALVTQIHDFDYAIWLFGQPSKLFSVGGQLSDLEVDVEDSVQILMQCNNKGKNLPVTLHLDYLQWPPSRTISIVGDKGSIQCNLTTMEIVVNDRIKENVKRHTFPSFDRNQLFLDEMKNFLEFVTGKEDPAVDLKNGIVSLRVALAAKESMNSENIQNFSRIWCDGE
jgi:predicted dehydrogenase